MLEQGLIMPVSLEMDADSDEELETLAEMYDQGAGGNGDGNGAQQVTRGVAFIFSIGEGVLRHHPRPRRFQGPVWSGQAPRFYLLQPGRSHGFPPQARAVFRRNAWSYAVMEEWCKAKTLTNVSACAQPGQGVYRYALLKGLWASAR